MGNGFGKMGGTPSSITPSSILPRIRLPLDSYQKNKIPGNYFTLNTIKAVAGAIGQVKEVAYDPEKSLFRNWFGLT